MVDAQLEARLLTLVQSGNVRIDPSFVVYRSAVHALLDCVFSAQAVYTTVERMRLRIAARPRLVDRPDLSMSEFLSEVESFGPDAYERFSREVLTRQKIAGRLKTKICCESAHFFATRGLQRKRDFEAATEAELERVVLQEWTELHGIGPTLARYFLLLVGRESHIKPDIMLRRFFARLTSEVHGSARELGVEEMRGVVQAVALAIGTTAARLDNAIWMHERSRPKGKLPDSLHPC